MIAFRLATGYIHDFVVVDIVLTHRRLTTAGTTHHQKQSKNTIARLRLLFITKSNVKSSCGAQRNHCAVRLLDFFDRYANSHSLYRPQGAVVLLAPSLGKGR